MKVQDRSASRIPRGADVGIPPRRMDFHFSPQGTDRYYFGGDPFLTSMMTALSAQFPAGESFFVDSVRAFRERIGGKRLRAEVAGFIGQEAMHSKEHLGFNACATQQGFPVDRLEEAMKLVAAFTRKYYSPEMQLAATVCAEHYTAIIAEMLLRDESVQDMLSTDVKMLWLWHALEENEHKSVAFDVFQEVDGRYWLRAGMMVPTTVALFGVTAAFQLWLLAADGQLSSVRRNINGIRYFWGRKGIFSRLLPKYLDFYKPGFHPSQHDTAELLDRWRERLFGKDGMIGPVH